MIVGMLLIFLGILFLLSQLSILALDINLIWPLVIIFIGLYHIVKSRRLSGFGILLEFIGIWFLMVHVGIIQESYTQVFVPVLIIGIGVWLVFRKTSFGNKMHKQIMNKEGMTIYNGIFTGINEFIEDKDFKGAIVNSFFGEVKLDFTNMETTRESITIDVNSIFGNTVLFIPDGYSVVLNSSNIFGGSENRYKGKPKEGNKTVIYINASSVFGGTEIR